MGGTQTTIQRFPWQLSMRINNEHKCGASIIAVNRAISAAHCYKPHLDDLKKFSLMAGSTLRFGDGGSVIVGVDKYIQHPNYNNQTLENDVAVIWMQRNLEFGTNIRPTSVSTLFHLIIKKNKRFLNS